MVAPLPKALRKKAVFKVESTTMGPTALKFLDEVGANIEVNFVHEAAKHVLEILI